MRLLGARPTFPDRVCVPRCSGSRPREPAAGHRPRGVLARTVRTRAPHLTRASLRDRPRSAAQCARSSGSWRRRRGSLHPLSLSHIISLPFSPSCNPSLLFSHTPSHSISLHLCLSHPHMFSRSPRYRLALLQTEGISARRLRTTATGLDARLLAKRTQIDSSLDRRDDPSIMVATKEFLAASEIVLHETLKPKLYCPPPTPPPGTLHSSRTPPFLVSLPSLLLLDYSRA